MSFPNNAFECDLTSESFMEMQKAQTSGVRVFKRKSSILEKPVIRQCEINSMISDTKGMTYDTFLKEYDDILRFIQFETLCTLRKHISHFRDPKIEQCTQCPHPFCLNREDLDNVDTVEILKDHIEQVHGIPKPRTTKRKRGQEDTGEVSKRAKGLINSEAEARA